MQQFVFTMAESSSFVSHFMYTYDFLSAVPCLHFHMRNVHTCIHSQRTYFVLSRLRKTFANWLTWIQSVCIKWLERIEQWRRDRAVRKERRKNPLYQGFKVISKYLKSANVNQEFDLRKLRETFFCAKLHNTWIRTHHRKNAEQIESEVGKSVDDTLLYERVNEFSWLNGLWLVVLLFLSFFFHFCPYVSHFSQVCGVPNWPNKQRWSKSMWVKNVCLGYWRTIFSVVIVFTAFLYLARNCLTVGLADCCCCFLIGVFGYGLIWPTHIYWAKKNCSSTFANYFCKHGDCLSISSFVKHSENRFVFSSSCCFFPSM